LDREASRETITLRAPEGVQRPGYGTTGHGRDDFCALEHPEFFQTLEHTQMKACGPKPAAG
jgi:hypothetical protein